MPNAPNTPMSLFKKPRPTLDSEQMQQLKTWTQDIMSLPPGVPISISQLQCHEVGCPPIETVIAVMTQPVQTFKIHAAAQNIDRTSLIQVLSNSATGAQE